MELSTNRTGNRNSHRRDAGSKERAENEQEDLPQTVERMFARISDPRGAGNAALAEFREARRDADQMNDLLGDKGYATYIIAVDVPAFSKG